MTNKQEDFKKRSLEGQKRNTETLKLVFDWISQKAVLL